MTQTQERKFGVITRTEVYDIGSKRILDITYRDSKGGFGRSSVERDNRETINLFYNSLPDRRGIKRLCGRAGYHIDVYKLARKMPGLTFEIV